MTDANLAQPNERPAMPPEAPIAMPAQPLSRWSKKDVRQLVAPGLWKTPWVSRIFVFSGLAVAIALGGREMYGVVVVCIL